MKNIDPHRLQQPLPATWSHISPVQTMVIAYCNWLQFVATNTINQTKRQQL